MNFLITVCEAGAHSEWTRSAGWLCCMWKYLWLLPYSLLLVYRALEQRSRSDKTCLLSFNGLYLVELFSVRLVHATHGHRTDAEPARTRDVVDDVPHITWENTTRDWNTATKCTRETQWPMPVSCSGGGRVENAKDRLHRTTKLNTAMLKKASKTKIGSFQLQIAWNLVRESPCLGKLRFLPN